MTDEEYDLMDELYFIQSFQQLKESLSWPEEALKTMLIDFFKKEWVKCFSNEEEEIARATTQIEVHYSDYFYVADKKGLIAHNSQ